MKPFVQIQFNKTDSLISVQFFNADKTLYSNANVIALTGKILERIAFWIEHGELYAP